MSGFIKLHRSIKDWEWYDDINCRLVFIHLILIANHKPKIWKGQTIERGQVIISTDGLAKDVGISVQSVKTALKKLKKSNQQRTPELTCQATSKYTIVTICKYDDYQRNEKVFEENQPTTQPTTNQQPNIPSTTTKEGKEVRSKEVIKDTTNVVSKNPPPSENDLIDDSLKTEEAEKEKKVAPKKRKVFAPPELEEVEKHLIEKFPDFQEWKAEASKFWNYYESKNWMVGKSKMQVWKAACTNWISRAKEFQNEKRNKKTGRANGSGSGGRRTFAERLAESVPADNNNQSEEPLSFTI